MRATALGDTKYSAINRRSSFGKSCNAISMSSVVGKIFVDDVRNELEVIKTALRQIQACHRR